MYRGPVHSTPSYSLLPCGDCLIPIQTPVYSTPIYSRPVDVAPVYAPINPTPSYAVPVPSKPTSIAPKQPEEMPAPQSPPRNPALFDDCEDCQAKAAKEVKTGGFVCANCKKVTVGEEWHTDWVGGVPITYLCDRCNHSLPQEKRVATYNAWAAKQSTKFPEVR